MQEQVGYFTLSPGRKAQEPSIHMTEGVMITPEGPCVSGYDYMGRE
jgi:hypothetical protein